MYRLVHFGLSDLEEPHFYIKAPLVNFVLSKIETLQNCSRPRGSFTPIKPRNAPENDCDFSGEDLETLQNCIAMALHGADIHFDHLFEQRQGDIADIIIAIQQKATFF